ncbi:SIS domain-containing protein [Seinonella peptonophila]|nr:SIS domain-containing protein [Seinonella peptonophila]
MMSMYIQQIRKLLDRIEQEGAEAIRRGADKIASAIENGGIVQIFGCGHSHILGEEVFYRAGGLAPVRVIFHEPLMLHEGAVTSSQIERKNDYVDSFIEQEEIRPEDVVIVASTSGKNPVPIDVALSAKEKGAYVIGLTSSAYANEPSRHKSGKRLWEVVDLVLDNYVEKGDAMIQHPSSSIRYGSASTVIGATIIHSLMIEVTNRLIENGYNPPPVFISGNVEGADEHNQKLVEKYQERIPLLS